MQSWISKVLPADSHPVATRDMKASVLRLYGKLLRKALFPSFLWLAAISNAALPTIEFVGGSFPEDIGAVDFLYTRRGDVSSLATVGYTVVPETAQAGVDYQFQDGQLIFMSGETNKRVISIPILPTQSIVRRKVKG
jgi:Calx-beta domain-containing protein